MGYEIDFLAVERGEKSGDAIAFRIGNLHGGPQDQFVGIVDGGYTEDGEKLVEHVRAHYSTNVVNVVISSHPDDDHCLGLEPVVEQMDVQMLWMHRPWNHAENIRSMFTDGRLTTRGLSDKFTRSLSAARTIEQIALRKGIPIVEPFSGEGVVAGGNRVYVAGPARAYYQQLLCDFDCAPTAKSTLGSLASYYGGGVIEAVKRKIEEKWDVETLSDSCSTSAENNSSTVLLINAAEEYWLLTGDTGAPALTQAIDYLYANGVEYSKIKFFQVPHHGSHHSVGPTILNYMLGPKLPAGSPMPRTAFVSSAKSALKHPSKRVTNAYRRRGVAVHATEGMGKVHWNDHPVRAGWGTSTPLPFYNEVEEE
jgi:beta-lactamase superfamily II metal-dependent hydrolase